jgi:alpha-galactosidase/6-phospho-beta-glucosidase family protein
MLRLLVSAIIEAINLLSPFQGGECMVKVALIGAGSAVFAQRMITDILAIDGLDAGSYVIEGHALNRPQVIYGNVRNSGNATCLSPTFHQYNLRSTYD